MVRGAITRVVSAAGLLAVAGVLMLGLAPGAAQAAPKPAAPKPTAVSIAGQDIADEIVIQQKDQSRLFSTLLDEVNWMATAKAQTSAPKADKLGPKFTLTVWNKTQPMQVYDLYPLATGGPRAHRAANQPGGKKADAWFYGRLTMPEALRVGGAPLQAKPDPISGGIGGGVGKDLDANDLDPVAGMNGFLGQMRRLLLLNGAVLVVILFGLAGIAFLIRRRV
jgi:hypothetical protein